MPGRGNTKVAIDAPPKSHSSNQEMSLKSRILLAALLACSLGAQAQVKKCVHLDGHVEYTEKPCTGGAAASVPKLTDNTTDGGQDRRQAYRQQEQQYQQQASGGGSHGSGGGNVNSHACQLAQREASMAGGSTTSTPQQRKMAVEAAQQKANNACYGGKQAASIERARAGRPVTNITVHQAPPPPRDDGPGRIYSCDNNSCHTDRGTMWK